jgi:hypothetical protein
MGFRPKLTAGYAVRGRQKVWKYCPAKVDILALRANLSLFFWQHVKKLRNGIR